MDHSIQECQEFFELVQEMMNEGEMEFCEKMEEQNAHVLQRETPKPVTILYRGGDQQASREVPHFPTFRLVMKVPAPFRYTSDKTVPCQAIVQEPQATTEQKQETYVNDITRMGGMTRNA